MGLSELTSLIYHPVETIESILLNALIAASVSYAVIMPLWEDLDCHSTQKLLRSRFGKKILLGIDLSLS